MAILSRVCSTSLQNRLSCSPFNPAQLAKRSISTGSRDDFYDKGFKVGFLLGGSVVGSVWGQLQGPQFIARFTKEGPEDNKSRSKAKEILGTLVGASVGFVAGGAICFGATRLIPMCVPLLVVTKPADQQKTEK